MSCVQKKLKKIFKFFNDAFLLQIVEFVVVITYNCFSFIKNNFQFLTFEAITVSIIFVNMGKC